MVATLAPSCAEYEPLAAPLPPAMLQERAVHVVLDYAALQQFASAVRVKAGKTQTIALPPWQGGADSAKVAAANLTLKLGEGTVSFGVVQQLVLSFPLSIAAQALVVQVEGAAACALNYAPTSAVFAFGLRFGRDALGEVDVTLSQPPALSIAANAIAPGPCRDAVGAVALEGAIAAALRDHLSARAIEPAMQLLRAIAPPSFEADLRVPLHDAAGTTAAIAISSKWRSQSDAHSLLTHNGAVASASLDVALDADRHPCAVDAGLPNAAETPLPIYAPQRPEAATVLTRAYTLGPATIERVAWALHRAGYFCRSAVGGVEARLPPGWPAVLPIDVVGLVDVAKVSASFWPGQTPSVKVVSEAGAATIAVRFPDAMVELSAPVDGVELVVLRIRGTLTVKFGLLPAINGLAMKVQTVESEGTVAETLLGPLPGIDAAASAAVLAAAIGGIFDGALALPSIAEAGASVAGARAVGGSLWLWLAGGGL